MTFIIQQTLLYAVPLMIVALAGVFAERSGIINLALEGIMIFGAFIGVLFVRSMQDLDVFVNAARQGSWLTLQGLEILAMLVSAALGALFSLLLSFASINLKADQTIGGTALNLMAPALVLFFVRILCNQNNIQMVTGDAASWFMLKKSTFGIPKNQDIGFLGETFLNKVYLATYVCILIYDYIRNQDAHMKRVLESVLTPTWKQYLHGIAQSVLGAFVLAFILWLSVSVVNRYSIGGLRITVDKEAVETNK